MNNTLKVISVTLILSFVVSTVFSAPISKILAGKIIQNKIVHDSKSESFRLKNIIEVYENNVCLFYLAELSPRGYMIISADDNLWPVIAYSWENNADLTNNLTEFFKHDVAKRLEAVDKLPATMIAERKAAWEKLLNDDFTRETMLEQWPAEGTTSSGGWIETNWNQTAPWNAMCPIDPVSGGRSYTGCPATAMAMILNYHKTTNETQFTDADDYHHNYAGRNYYIDDDYEVNGFPSFPDLNKYLDTVNMHWFEHEGLLSNQDMAALTFACGVAATQVFTSEGSGTFGVNQALAAYYRFGCENVILYTETDAELFPKLISNMQNALPAHFAIVDEAWSSGHNVVVDGYNTDNYFHVNFGWGGTYNGWYLLPDEMPYGLTVIEGIEVDIMKDDASDIAQSQKSNKISIYPNPTNEKFTISNCVDDYELQIFDLTGRLICSQKIYGENVEVETSSLTEGIYVVSVHNENEKVYSTKLQIIK
jgi:hypothetical protein